MTTWHRDSCKYPDVYPTGDSCYCSKCDTLAPLDQIVPDKNGFVPALPELPTLGDIRCVWPNSVHYWSKDPDIQVTSAGRKTKGDKTSQQTSPSTTALKLNRVYTPLKATNQIRLLQISKGNLNDPIHGTLMVAQLSSGIKFQALSYTWADASGDDSRSQVIFLGPRWDIFMVTASCKAALRRLRRKGSDTMAWIDAICINQGDDSERTLQVGLMKSIYSAASEVFVYLGETSSLNNEAFERLMWAKEHQSIDEKGRQSLRNLFNMRYFYRIWVIQEIANAKLATIHYGDNAIGWSILEEERLKTLDIFDSVPKWILSIYMRQEYTTRDLPNLLFSTISSGASDPRDKVFGLLGLIRDADEFGLTADYSLTLQEVEIGVAAFFIIHEDDCSILVYAVGNNRTWPFTPSWVPTWDKQYRSTPIPRDSKMFDGRVILRAEHVTPHVASNPILGHLEKPQIHHVRGLLSILALKLMDMSHLTDPWVKHLSKSGPSQISGFYPGLSLVLDQEARTSDDYIVILKGCDVLFHVRKHSSGGTYEIVGVCNILLSSEGLNHQQNTNILDMDVVSHFMLKNCPLKREHLQQIIEFETLLKQLDCWDNENYPSPDNVLHESLFLDKVITRVFTAYIKELNIDFTQPEPESLDFEEDESSLLPITTQIQYLTSRLQFWDSPTSWKLVNALNDVCTSYIHWRDLRAKLENTLFISMSGGWAFTELEKSTGRESSEFAKLTLSLIKQLLLLLGITSSYMKMRQCRLRIGKLHITILASTSSSERPHISTTDTQICSAISGVFKQCYDDYFSSGRISLAGFRKNDDNVFTFEEWDWAQFEDLFDLLKASLGGEGGNGELQGVCSARIFLRELLPRVREWEWVTIA